MTLVVDAARRELRRGRQPIPIPRGQKYPTIRSWQTLIFTEDDLARSINGKSNLGILNGAPSRNQIDVDLDCREALALADRSLPPTRSVFGRPGKPRSHRLYVCDPLPSTTQYRDVDGTMLLELRSTGTQTLFPPSIHPNGEQITWAEDGEPTPVDGDLLSSRVAKAAAACILARHWPLAGGRHDAALALAGGLLRLGWSEEEGAAFIAEVADVAGDEETRQRVATAAYTARRLAEGRTATGWKRLAQFVGGDVVDRARTWLGAGNSENSEYSETAWEPPVPLAELPRPHFPTDIFPSWMRDFVEAVAVATQTPAALGGMLVLSALAAACAKTVVVRVTPDWREPVNLFTATAMAPAERKSAVFAEATRPIVAFEAAEIARLAPAVAEAHGRRKIAEQALARAQKDATNASGPEQAKLLAKADEMARANAATNVLGMPQLIVDDCSPERLASLLAEQGGRIAVMAPEGDVFDLMAGRYSANGAPNFGVYLRGHAGDDLRVDRVGRHSEFVRAPALTVGLAIQPEVVQGLATRPGFRGRGLLGRFLYAMPDSLVGRRETNPPAVPEHVRAAYHRKLTALLALAPQTPSEGRGHPTPHELTLAPEAAGIFHRFRAGLEPRLGDLGDLGHIRDWAGKLAGAVARIAGLLHMAEHTDHQQPWAQSITEATMSAAIRLADTFLIPHALAAFAQMGADPAVADAGHVLRFLADRDVDRFTKRDLFQLVKGRFKTVEPLERALAVLEEHGYVHPLPGTERSGPGRKPSPRFAVNPLWCAHCTGPTGSWAPEDVTGQPGDEEEVDTWAAQNAHNPQNAKFWDLDRDSEDSGNCEDADEEVVEWSATV